MFDFGIYSYVSTRFNFRCGCWLWPGTQGTWGAEICLCIKHTVFLQRILSEAGPVVRYWWREDVEPAALAMFVQGGWR